MSFAIIRGRFAAPAGRSTPSGRRCRDAGTVHSWTVCHHAFLPAFKVEIPYIVAIVDLDGGVRANLPLMGAADQAISIGMPVEIAYRAVSDALTLPVLVKARTDA